MLVWKLLFTMTTYQWVVDEVPLMEDVDEEGYGFYAVRKAEYDDTPETAKKEAQKLYYPSVTSGVYCLKE